MTTIAESPLTRQQVRERLRFGDVALIAARTRRTRGHVSQVLSGKRADRKVAVALARMLGVRLSDLPVELYEAA